ncbi:hypothetical protein AB0L53_46120 [Nonomuraea sp. NPDC052129]
MEARTDGPMGWMTEQAEAGRRRLLVGPAQRRVELPVVVVEPTEAAG